MATDWSITHSPTPRYLSTHFDTSLFSPATLSVLKLGLDGSPSKGWAVSFTPFACCAAPPLPSKRCLDPRASTHVRPVDRFIPARNAETNRKNCLSQGRRARGTVKDEATHREQRQMHNGSGDRALTTTPESANRGAGGNLDSEGTTGPERGP